jgi:hypothetical protein
MNSSAIRNLPAKERQLLLLIERRGRLLTRVKELGDGDYEFLQHGGLPQSSAGALVAGLLDEDDLLTCLHALKSRGLVASNVTVFAASTTEYLCEWKLADPIRTDGQAGQS